MDCVPQRSKFVQNLQGESIRGPPGPPGPPGSPFSGDFATDEEVSVVNYMIIDFH